MANLKAIRKRIQGVRGTLQLTRAMKLVAAAKLRRAQENALALRPYAANLVEVIGHVAGRLDAEEHPLLASRPERRSLLLCYTSDRGLCGAFNLNVGRAAEDFFRQHPGEGAVTAAVIGKKGNEYLTRRDYPVEHYFKDMFADVSFDRISRIGSELTREFLSGGYDSLYVLYNWFRSAGSQRVTLQRVLPLDLSGCAERTGTSDRTEHIFEPGKTEILDALLPMYVNISLYQALLESVASEMGARMTAMDSATRNAGELIQKLTLLYNKARQDTITKDLMDIVGGAEALR
ncbi:MAG: ATP synthase F1 subunit gamma [Deltaproteobacteria bacterium]|nr:ATP synthase F1 subunit gamma [Deltaproteobacteria bacterium]